MTNQNEHERDATHALKRARAYPYADIQPTDAAAHAAQAIAYDLCDRRGIKYEMRQVDAEVRREIVLAHAAIIRAAIQAQASGQAAWAIITPELSALAWQRAIAQGDAAGHMHLRVARQVVELMGGQASGQAVPSGWKLVPVEPTDRMTWVGQSLRPDTEISIGSIYAAMLAAAPTASAAAQWAEPSDDAIATLAKQYDVHHGGFMGFARALLSRYGAQPAVIDAVRFFIENPAIAQDVYDRMAAQPAADEANR